MKTAKISPAWMVAGVGWMGRFVGMFTSFAVLRFNLQALGPDNYAVLALLLGLSSWFALFDLGIGTWLQNIISHGRAQDKETEFVERQALSLILIISLVVTLIGLAFSQWVSSWLLSGFNFVSPRDKARLFQVALVLQLCAMLGGVYTKFLFSKMLGIRAHIITTSASLMTALAVFMVKDSELAGLLSLTCVSLLPAAIFALACFMIRLRFSLMWPSWSFLKEAIRGGSGFFRFYLLGTITLNCDLVIAARNLPAAEMASYSVVVRLFNVFLVLYASILSAVWPHCSEAFAKSDFMKITGVLRNVMMVGVIGLILFTAFVLLTSGYIASYLSPREVLLIPFALVVGMGANLLVRIWCDAHALVLQSCSAVGEMFYYNLAQAGLSVLLQVVFVRYLGAVGIVWGIALSFVFTVAWALPRLTAKLVAGR